MNGDAGGWLWLVIDVGLVAILAAALAYGIFAWRQRSRRSDPARERRTRELYRHSSNE